jgi:hypothetical protein
MSVLNTWNFTISNEISMISDFIELADSISNWTFTVSAFSVIQINRWINFVIFECWILIVFNCWFCESTRIDHYFIKFLRDIAIECHHVCIWVEVSVLHICMNDSDDERFVLQTDSKMRRILINIQICMKIDKIMTEWSVNEISDHWFRIFHWFKDDYECLNILILLEEWEWWKFNHKSFYFSWSFRYLRHSHLSRVLRVLRIQQCMIDSLIHLIDKTIFKLSFCIFAFISCMFCWSTLFFLTNEAYFLCTILTSSILIFSIMIFSILFLILIFTILTDSKWKISMITTIDEWSELDEKRELDEVSFLINNYWRFQIINQLCQNLARFKACILTCRNLLTCISELIMNKIVDSKCRFEIVLQMT